MSQKNKFYEHALVTGFFLWAPVVAAGVSAFTLLIIGHPETIPILAVSGLGLFLIICAKWRLLRSKQMTTFGYGRLTKAERMFYLAGYFFIACAFFTAVYVTMAVRTF